MLDIDKVVNRLQHYKHLKKILEAHETGSASIALRKKWYTRQNHNNYMNEYERIRCELSRSVLKGASKAHLERRKNIRSIRCCCYG